MQPSWGLDVCCDLDAARNRSVPRPAPESLQIASRPLPDRFQTAGQSRNILELAWKRLDAVWTLSEACLGPRPTQDRVQTAAVSRPQPGGQTVSRPRPDCVRTVARLPPATQRPGSGQEAVWNWSGSGLETVWMHSGSGLGPGRAQTGTRPQPDRVQSASRQLLDHLRPGNGLEAVWKRSGSGLEAVRTGS